MEPVVRTVYGDVRGLVSDGVAAFKGISYAAPPFGPNRMRPPVHPEACDGVRDVTAFGPTVPKPSYPSPFDVFLPEPVIAGGDCLNLNVWTAEPSPGPGLHRVIGLNAPLVRAWCGPDAACEPDAGRR